MPTGRFELVAGERRVRASRMAGKSTIPAVIKVYTDSEANQARLSENMHREDHHPLDQAHGIAILRTEGKSIEDIALVLGKSKAFVYNRISLYNLIDPMKEIFYAGKIGIQDAAEISVLSADSQEQFFNSHCKQWENPSFYLQDVKYYVSRYKYDLKRAPFNPEQTDLVPEAGACIGCPFNSASMGVLFPEMAKESKCLKAICFQSKCEAQLASNIREAVLQYKPDALLLNNPPEQITILIDSLIETAGMPTYNLNEVTTFEIPVMPQKEDFFVEPSVLQSEEDDEDYDYGQEDEDDGFDDEDDDFDEDFGTSANTHTTDAKTTETGQEPPQKVFDEEGYNEALEEYHVLQTAHNARLVDEKHFTGLILKTSSLTTVLFNCEHPVPAASSLQKVTSKMVQEATKSGNLTIELIDAEISRINDREKRAKELDAEKLQLELHKKFSTALAEGKLKEELTPADQTAVRLLIYESLSYSARHEIDKVLFPEYRIGSPTPADERLTAFSNMTEQHFIFLVRSALGAKSDSKLPKNIDARCLYSVAQQAGLNVQDIEKAQQAKADEREDKMEIRVKELQKKRSRLEKKMAA